MNGEVIIFKCRNFNFSLCGLSLWSENYCTNIWNYNQYSLIFMACILKVNIVGLQAWFEKQIFRKSQAII